MTGLNVRPAARIVVSAGEFAAQAPVLVTPKF